jgi:DNA polymerase III delta prime subunit
VVKEVAEMPEYSVLTMWGPPGTGKT